MEVKLITLCSYLGHSGIKGFSAFDQMLLQDELKQHPRFQYFLKIQSIFNAEQ